MSALVQCWLFFSEVSVAPATVLIFGIYFICNLIFLQSKLPEQKLLMRIWIANSANNKETKQYTSFLSSIFSLYVWFSIFNCSKSIKCNPSASSSYLVKCTWYKLIETAFYETLFMFFWGTYKKRFMFFGCDKFSKYIRLLYDVHELLWQWSYYDLLWSYIDHIITFDFNCSSFFRNLFFNLIFSNLTLTTSASFRISVPK